MNSVVIDVASESLRCSLTRALADVGIEAAPTWPQSRLGPALVVRAAPGSKHAVLALTDELACRWRMPPAAVLISTSEVGYSRAEALMAGADDLLQWPEQAAEFAARVTALLRRRACFVDAHPLTGLPGGAALQRAIEQRIAVRGDLAVLSLDLRHFKPYNDRYGFERGDAVIASLADLIESVASAGEIVYHIGGDDFFVLSTPQGVDAVGEHAVERFDERSHQHYEQADLSRGYITGLSRATGDEVRFPLMSLTAVCATNEADDVTHIGHIAAILAELKQYARRRAGSAYVRDRRSVHSVEQSLRLRDSLTGGPGP